jgi:hypothetical protein
VLNSKILKIVLFLGIINKRRRRRRRCYQDLRRWRIERRCKIEKEREKDGDLRGN